MQRWRIMLIGLVVMVPLVWVLSTGFGRDPHAIPSVLVGQNAPNFTLQTLNQSSTMTAEQFKNQPIIINFWSSWCEPCRAEHALLQQSAAQNGDKIQFIGIIYQDKAKQIRQFLKTHTSSYPQLLDPHSNTAIDYGVAGVPETFFINTKGKIMHKQAGPLTSTILHEQITRLLSPQTITP